ncbi:hypothetical protein KCP70_00290 [Salmonella enterica subsp. enterica]|nr:hypothetical protein KCP70_00290 [Salmonella enterica subsp. enterica]
MKLLKAGRVKATGTEHPAPDRQATEPATGVVTDKGVPQSDSFAKYAAAFNVPFVGNLQLASGDSGRSPA